MVSLPSSLGTFEGEGWLTVAPEAGVSSIYETPRLELYGSRPELERALEALARLIPDQVSHLQLTLAPSEKDPDDLRAKHLLRVHAKEFPSREPIWATLYPLGVRVFRWLIPHWRWDVFAYGIVSGPAPAPLVKRALDVLEEEGSCDRLIYLEPEGSRDEAVRSLLRNRGEVLVRAGGSGDDPDRPPERIETAVTGVLTRRDPARDLLKKTGHRLVVVPESSHALVAEGETQPYAPLVLELKPERRYVLSPGKLVETGLVLALSPKDSEARWIRIA